jgi:hypothetical protein
MMPPFLWGYAWLPCISFFFYNYTVSYPWANNYKIQGIFQLSTMIANLLPESIPERIFSRGSIAPVEGAC